MDETSQTNQSWLQFLLQEGNVGHGVSSLLSRQLIISVESLFRAKLHVRKFFLRRHAEFIRDSTGENSILPFLYDIITPQYSRLVPKN